MASQPEDQSDGVRVLLAGPRGRRNQHVRLRTVLAVASVVLLAFGLSGCAAGSSHTPTSDASDAGMPAKDLSRWTLPLDQFAYTSGPLREYSDALMESRCLTTKGVNWQEPWQPLDRSDLGPSYTAGGARLFNEKIAAQYGYHTIPVTYQGQQQWVQARQELKAMAQRDPNVGVEVDACLAQTLKMIPNLPVEDQNYATEAASGISESSLQGPSVESATTKWQSCIAAGGFGGLADTPAKMPGEAKSAQWLAHGVSLQPSAAEVQTAVADAKCRVSSGWSQAYYDAEYARQVAFVRKNADRLDRVREELKKDHDRLIAATTKYAPQ